MYMQVPGGLGKARHSDGDSPAESGKHYREDAKRHNEEEQSFALFSDCKWDRIGCQPNFRFGSIVVSQSIPPECPLFPIPVIQRPFSPDG